METPGRNGLVGAVAALLAIVCLSPLSLARAETGEAKQGALACGDTIAGTVRLSADLHDCRKNGLQLRSGAVLDCAGHEIRGRGPAASDTGVRLDGVRGAEVRNCRITGFRRGVRIRGGRDNRVIANDLEENVYGVDVAGATKAGTSSGHLIAENRIRKSGMDGIHLGTGTEKTTLAENVIQSSGQEGLYFQWCEGCRAIANTVEGSGSAALYIKHSSNGLFADNEVEGSLVQVRGESSHNVFARNELIGSGFVFEGYVGRDEGRDPSWIGIPHDNQVVGGAIVGRKVCFRFNGAHDNRVDDVLVRDCKGAQERSFGDKHASGNALSLRRSNGDLDGDRIDDAVDPCTDADRDGFGEAGFSARTCVRDNCPQRWNPDQADADGDGVGDACDVCPLAGDPAQRDADGDGDGDACDGCNDPDGDGHGLPGEICHPADNCPEIANADQSDLDLDGKGDACDACPAFADADADPESDAGCAPEAFASLTEAERSRFEEGLLSFTRTVTPAAGLGPVFNGESCAECHSDPTIGGGSRRTVTLFGAARDGRFDALAAHGGPLLQSQGVRTVGCSATGEAVPQGAAVRRRQSPSLYGVGLVDAIPEEAILERADPDDRDGDGISGRANRIGGRVGRFGWKAHEPSLRDFTARALLEEIGVTTPLLPEETALPGRGVECDTAADPEDDGVHLEALTAFLQLLSPLPGGERSEAAEHGAALFEASGCASCHTEELRTGPSEVAALHLQPVRLFSDLLLHDMGEGLADGIEQGEAAGSEFRTAPLWGLSQRRLFLHDGRAPTVQAAIAQHGGEGTEARERFLALAVQDREALIAYLETL